MDVKLKDISDVSFVTFGSKKQHAFPKIKEGKSENR
ncbi:hypothetical protein HMPREF9466_01740 [Fusobacterium necrophorum subsp. funduliforme 1_1_36S]|nr:hypothetical protein HMPREF9466_01740 [Fusobacterium necrophorum subsp. funduliforme 1_1_36S]